MGIRRDVAAADAIEGICGTVVEVQAVGLSQVSYDQVQVSVPIHIPQRD